MSERGWIVVAISCLCAFPTAAAPPKAPWEWTPAERAAARRDPARRLDRVRAYQAELRATSARGTPVADVLDGRTNPELYFTGELFEVLVRSSFLTLPRAFPNVVRQRSSDLFRDPAEWSRFAAIAAEYTAVLDQERAAANAVNRGRVTELQSLKCTAAARALREARRTFGRARFDRMLYEAVAPDLRMIFSLDTDFDTSVTRAREREERCQ
jgi:hypothetical protein